MMQKIWQKKPELNYNDIIDIVKFGSSVIEEKEARDIDIAIIFKKIPMKEQLIQAQKIKKELEKLNDKEIHISSFDLEFFFEASNFSREGILFYGISIITDEPFAKKFGLTPKFQISYSLRKLRKKDKIRFNYLLGGRGGRYGLLRRYGGNLVKPGLIEIAPRYEEVFKRAISKITADFSFEKIFVLEK